MEFCAWWQWSLTEPELWGLELASAHYLSFYPRLARSQCLNFGLGLSQHFSPVYRWLILESCLCRVGDRRAAAFSPHRYSGGPIFWVQIVWQKTWPQDHPESPECRYDLEHSPSSACALGLRLWAWRLPPCLDTRKCNTAPHPTLDGAAPVSVWKES